MEIDIAERIKSLRVSSGYSANRLATISGISQSYIRKLENGECVPTVETLSLICDALHIDLADFLGMEEDDSANYRKLRALKLIGHLSDDQLDGLIKLINPLEK